MSVNRENVIWQRKDGTWARGFYTVLYPAYTGEDWDYEWDVDYDFNSFEWASTGHSTMEGAWDAWNGANPGGHQLVRHKEHPAEVRRLEDMLAKFQARLRAH